jgi:hypothetical protein
MREWGGESAVFNVRSDLNSAREGYDDDETSALHEQVVRFAFDCSAARFDEGTRGDPMPSGN